MCPGLSCRLIIYHYPTYPIFLHTGFQISITLPFSGRDFNYFGRGQGSRGKKSPRAKVKVKDLSRWNFFLYPGTGDSLNNFQPRVNNRTYFVSVDKHTWVTSQVLQYFFIHHTGGEGRERKVKRTPIHHHNHDISQEYATIYMNFKLFNLSSVDQNQPISMLFCTPWARNVWHNFDFGSSIIGSMKVTNIIITTLVCQSIALPCHQG